MTSDLIILSFVRYFHSVIFKQQNFFAHLHRNQTQIIAMAVKKKNMKCIVAGFLAVVCCCCGWIQATADNVRAPPVVDIDYFEDRVKRQREAMKLARAGAQSKES